MNQTITVIGAGDMGHGLATHFGLHGWDVRLVDHRQSNLDDAEARIRDIVRFHNDEGLSSTSPDEVLVHISSTLNQDEGVSDADFVLETVSEDLDTKREVFASVADAAPSDAVLASNTSGLPITEIATGNDAADRILGCH